MATYLHLITTITGALNGVAIDANELACDGIVTGSDEEQILVAAAKVPFPNCKQLFCMLHCKDNVRHYLTSISVASAHREHILGQLFGCKCVSESSDECTMDDTTAEVMQ